MGDLIRYSLINIKNKREIVLLQGLGCRYKRCNFCDYYLDVSNDMEDINLSALSCVTGKYGILEIINSGSFCELTKITLDTIRKVAYEQNIHTLIFECHYLYRHEIVNLKKFFKDFIVKVKLGLESFDYNLRENIMLKGINEHSPEIIANDFDEANFLIGIKGQTKQIIENDIVLGLRYFERICVNVMCDNSKLKADTKVIDMFCSEIYPLYKDNERIDFLLNNTDFGVG